MQDNVVKYMIRIRNCYLAVMGILTAYELLKYFSSYSQMSEICTIVLVFMFLYGSLDYWKQKWKHKSQIIVTRTIELCFLSFFCFGSVDYYAILISNLAMLLILLELIFVNDITELETRLWSLLFVATPFFIIMTVLSFYHKEYLLAFKGILLASCLFSIYLVTELLSVNITDSQKIINKLKRLADDTTRANQALSAQQEKVKKANEKLSIQKIQLEAAYEKINRAAKESNTQNMISKYISSTLEMKTLLELITEAIQNSLGLDTCAIFLLPVITGNDSVMYKIRSSLSQESVDLMSHQMSNGGFDQYIKSEKTYIDNYVEAGRYAFINGNELKSLIIVPLVEKDVIYGALVCGKGEAGYFNEDVAFFENVVAQLIIAIHNASLYSKMQQMAVVDGLTGLYNRGHLNQIFDQYEKQGLSTYSLTEAMIDIDHFKMVNDSYGHLFGDEVLKKVAMAARRLAERYDAKAYRYGGEEFVILFPNKNVKQCHQYMVELQEEINNLKLVYGNQIVMVHISVGIASYPETCENISELLNATDGAMYYSKEHGRNRITVDSASVRKFSKQVEGDS